MRCSACFPNSTIDAGTVTYPGDTPQPLRRALQFIDERAGDPITLNEIATAARLSPRGPQAAFHRHLDTTPLAYLRSVRMERAHRDLQYAELGDGTSVAGVAARWGFTHLGRFAIEHRRRFGSYPSQTLRGWSCGHGPLRWAADLSIPVVAPRRRSCSGYHARPGAAC